MGTMEKEENCQTCNCDFVECPGHFGYINLARPVYHPGYINHIHKILRCICQDCGRLKLREKDIRDKILRLKSNNLKWKYTYMNCSKLKECKSIEKCEEYPLGIGCGKFSPNYTREGLSIIQKSDTQKGSAGEYKQQNDPKSIISPDEVIRIFKKIPDEDIRLLGMDPKLSRPEWMVIKALAVAPPPVRPSVEAGDGMRSNDDLTYGYTSIVRTNNELRKQIKIGSTEKIQQDLTKNLQVLVATLMDNNQPDQIKQKHNGGRPIKCIRSRLKAKEGRVRGNLMGKRVDFSARTVITPDPILALDQLGVPEMIAMNLTVPEYVTDDNIKQMRQLVQNGPNKWPGAKYVIRRNDNKLRDLDFQRNSTDSHLDVGYIVERHLRDGDYVIFNRQPSLHKMSLMGHRVKVLPFQTFRLNLSVTKPYNADFDGDEMNMHVPQSYETMAEIKEIMAVPNQVIAPKDNKPVMGIVQDSCLGIMLMTIRDNFLELDQVMNLIMWFDFENKKAIRDGKLPTPAILRPKKLWSGKQILSLVLPQINFKNLDNKDTLACPKDSNIIIKRGELLCGVMRSKQIGASSGGLVHITQRDLGGDATNIFLSNTQNLVNNWLLGNGFSVGVQDIVSNQNIVDKIQSQLQKFKRKVQRITQKTQRGKLETLPGKGMLETYENEVNTALRDAIATAGSITKQSLPSWNRLNNMVTSGSKGSDLNISQIMACVGQQNVEGQRIRFGFHRRTLPHFSKDDFGLDSKGFVSSCYFFGLTPQEFYFHAMGGREGLIDTACKTAETGYIQRRLIKTLEDIQVRYDMTVRTARDLIIQFLYGEDGMNAEKIENLSIPLLNIDNKQLEKKFDFFDRKQEIREKRYILSKCIDQQQIQQIENQGYENLQTKLNEELKQLYDDREELRNFIMPKTGRDSISLPINMPRLIWNSKEKYNIQPNSISDIDPQYVIDQTRSLINSIQENAITIYQNNKLNKSWIFNEANENALKLIKIYLRQFLASKFIIQENRLNKDSFDVLIGEVRERFKNSLVHPGEMIGSIGAQSIGEPATQMTLNTFHMAGVASKNMTQGVPRLKEIINVATTMKTPSLRILMQPEFRKDRKATTEVGNKIEFTNLGQVVANSSIYYDPDPKQTIIQADKQLLEYYNDTFIEQNNQKQEYGPWIIRFEIDDAKLQGKDLTLVKIVNRIKQLFQDYDIEIIRDLQSKNQRLVLRLRLPNLDEEDSVITSVQKVKMYEEILLNQLELKGFHEITKVSYSCTSQASNIVFYNQDTGKKCEEKGNWMIETDGVALKKVMAVDKVDFCSIRSNNIQEIFSVLGIEAARKGLQEELDMILNPYNVNHRHLATLIDIMTVRGKLMSITRHGINRVDDAGALRKCSFEETVEILLEASFHAELDPLLGVTENIIMGQLAPYGTGSFEVMMDLKQINNNSIRKQQHESQNYLFKQIITNGDATPIVEPSPEQFIQQQKFEVINTPNQSIYNLFTSPAPRIMESTYQFDQIGQQNEYQQVNSPIYMPNQQNTSQNNQFGGSYNQFATPGYQAAQNTTIYNQSTDQANMSPFYDPSAANNQWPQQ